MPYLVIDSCMRVTDRRLAVAVKPGDGRDATYFGARNTFIEDRSGTIVGRIVSVTLAIPPEARHKGVGWTEPQAENPPQQCPEPGVEHTLFSSWKGIVVRSCR